MRCSTYNFKYFLQELILPDCEDDISESSFRQMGENGWSDEDDGIIFNRSAQATQNFCDCVITGDIRLIQANLLANPMCLHDTDECVSLAFHEFLCLIGACRYPQISLSSQI
jgi:hypothetical protein